MDDLLIPGMLMSGAGMVLLAKFGHPYGARKPAEASRRAIGWFAVALLLAGIAVLVWSLYLYDQA